MIEFPPYRLDRRAGRLWRGDRVVPLRPKAWALLLHLAERPGTLVPKEELHAAIWADAVVSDDTLSSTVAELRRALRDSARTPRVIETVHRRGFRFVARVSESPGAQADPPSAAGTPSASDAPSHPFVGRDAELRQLHALFGRAANGRRQIAFVVGEPGIGKSALIDAFVADVRGSSAPIVLGYGQCVEQYGEREAYMPVLEALERLGHGPDRGQVQSALRAVAPSWLAQLPSLQERADAADTQLWRQDTTPQRMLREFATLVETLAADVPLLLVLEDMHWSDQATVDLVSVLATRPDPARLMLVATYRPAQAVVLEHPIKDVAVTLRARRQCVEVALESLTRRDAVRYLERRLSGAPVDGSVATVVHGNTDGNPLYMMLLVDHLLARRWLAKAGETWTLTTVDGAVEREMPESLRQVIQGQLRFVSRRERDALEVASVGGVAFDAPAVAAGLDCPVEEVEATCHGLCSGNRWLRYLGIRRWPDGVVAARYAFQHALYHRTLYDGVPPTRRAALHQRIGAQLEAAFQDRTAEVASELARHFEGSRDARRALVYLEHAAMRAYDRRAYADVVACLESALRLIADLPETADRDRDELRLRKRQALVLSETAGYTSRSFLETLTRTRALAERLADVSASFDALCALVQLHHSHGQPAAAQGLEDQLWPLAERLDAFAALQCHFLRGRLAFWRGQLDVAQSFLARALVSPTDLEEAGGAYGVNPVVAARSFEALRRWLAGDPAGAHAIQAEALALAEKHGRPYTVAQAATFTAFLLLLDEEWAAAEPFAARALALADEYAFPRWLGTAMVLVGRARCEQYPDDRAIAQIRDGLAALWRLGGRYGSSLLLAFQAGACLRLRLWDEGLAAADAGLTHCRDWDEHVFEAELWRLRAEILLQRARAAGQSGSRSLDAVNESFERSLAVARAHGARALEHRARAAITRAASR